MCSGPTCSAILLPSFPPHPRTPSHGEGSARTWSTRPYRDTDASEWSRWDVHDQKGYPTVVTPQQARRSSVAGPCPSRSEEHTSELQSLMRISYAVFCLKK